MTHFTWLTRSTSGRRLAVNLASVAYIDRGDDITLIIFAGGETLRVAETPEEIEAMAVPPPSILLSADELSQAATTVSNEDFAPPVEPVPGQPSPRKSRWRR